MGSINHSIPFVASPNCSSRRGWKAKGIVIHYTAGGRASGTVRWFANPESRASAHFVISRVGEVTQMVDLSMKAWHAGLSEMRVAANEVLSNTNKFTIGIELANYGWLHEIDGVFYYELSRKMRMAKIGGSSRPKRAKLIYDNGTILDGWWEPYPEEQLSALENLLYKIKAHYDYGSSVRNIVGHESIAMPFAMRKRDPGPLFPWERFGGWQNQRTTGELVEVAT